MATQSGLARYDTVLFSLHTVQHVLLGMVAPLLLALGAPITLALQAAHRPTQRTLLRLVHSRPVAVLTHPLVAWTVFGGTLFALYLSPLLEWSLRNDLLHVDHPPPLPVGRDVVLLARGRARSDAPARSPTQPASCTSCWRCRSTRSSDSRSCRRSKVIGGAVYGSVHRSWGASPLADQRTGAAILWAVGDLFGLVAGAVVVAQWIRYDERRQAREDQRLDAEAAGAT